MREFIALARASWLAESSYRLNMSFSILSLGFVVVPIYFIANALQPVMASSISSQSRTYFAFTIIGAVTLTLITGSMSALPAALASAIGRGTLEAFLATPVRPLSLFAGISAYSVCWAALRAVVMLAASILLGVRIAWSHLAIVGVLLALLVLAHVAIGMIAASLLLCFKTTGPLLNGVLTLSGLLGGVYYPVQVMPGWLQKIAGALPLSHGLPAIRAVALLGKPFGAVQQETVILAAYTGLLVVVAGSAMALSLDFAKRQGTLSHY